MMAVEHLVVVPRSVSHEIGDFVLEEERVPKDAIGYLQLDVIGKSPLLPRAGKNWNYDQTVRRE